MLLEGSGRGVFTVKGFQPCCPIGWDFCHLPLLPQQPARKSFEVHVGDLWGSTYSSHVSLPLMSLLRLGLLSNLLTWRWHRSWLDPAWTCRGCSKEHMLKSICYCYVKAPLEVVLFPPSLSLFPRKKCPRASCSALKPKSPPSQPVRLPFTVFHIAILPTPLVFDSDVVT